MVNATCVLPTAKDQGKQVVRAFIWTHTTFVRAHVRPADLSPVQAVQQAAHVREVVVVVGGQQRVRGCVQKAGEAVAVTQTLQVQGIEAGAVREAAAGGRGGVADGRGGHSVQRQRAEILAGRADRRGDRVRDRVAPVQLQLSLQPHVLQHDGSVPPRKSALVLQRQTHYPHNIQREAIVTCVGLGGAGPAVQGHCANRHIGRANSR